MTLVGYILYATSVMSDYWKSTPKYWCKHCGVYVRDTKLERTNHEATGKHKSNLNRFLRSIHRENEQNDRDKQRAKDEIARLNGLSSARDETTSRRASQSTELAQNTKQITPDERKRQIEGLAKLGVAIPDEYRQDLAMVSEWRAVSKTNQPVAMQSDIADGIEPASSTSHSPSNLKRKADDSHAMENQAERSKKVAWGLITRTYHDSKVHTDDIDALLSGVHNHDTIKSEETQEGIPLTQPQSSEVTIKIDNSMEQRQSVATLGSVDEHEIVFKRRRSKATK